jgi:hypothetical protein
MATWFSPTDDVSLLFARSTYTSKLSTDVRLLAGDKVWWNVVTHYVLLEPAMAVAYRDDLAAFSGYLIFTG